MRYIFSLLAVLWLTPASATEIAGIELADEVRVDDVPLKLNGGGVRSKFFVKVYVAGLYVATPASDAATLIDADEPKRVHMHFVRSVDRQKLADAWRDGFSANSAPPVHGGLADRIEAFVAMFNDVDEGDDVRLDYLPGRGTRVEINGAEHGTVAGKDFNDALLRVWLGDEPVTDELKAALLGG